MVVIATRLCILVASALIRIQSTTRKLSKMDTKIILISLLSLFFGTVNCVDLWSAREQPCFGIKDTVPLDPNWVNSVDTWYYPRMSRYDLYNIALDLVGGTAGDVEEGAMYYDSCITFNFYSNGSFVSRGYNGRAKEYLSKEIKPNTQEVQFFPADGKGYSATLYTTLTDNKTFAFFPECTKDGVMAWCVLTPLKSLPDETWQKIRRHALSIGFKKEYFTELRYTDSCSNSAVSPTPSPPGNSGWGPINHRRH